MAPADVGHGAGPSGESGPSHPSTDMGRAAADTPPTGGMLVGFPMARCGTCTRWSYLAHITGRCLGCAPTPKESAHG